MKNLLLVSLFILLFNISVLCQIDTKSVGKKLFELKTNSKFEEAITYLSELIASNPNEVWLYLRRAEVFAHQKKIDESIEDVSKAIQIEPNEAFYYFKRADYFDLKNDRKSFLKDLQTAISIDPNNKPIRIQVAQKLYKVGLFEESLSTVAVLTASTQTFPINYYIYEIRYQNKYYLKDYEGSFEDAISAIESVPVEHWDNNIRAFSILGNLADFDFIFKIITQHFKDDDKILNSYHRSIELLEKKAKEILNDLPTHEDNDREIGFAKSRATSILAKVNLLLINCAKFYDSKGQPQKSEELLDKLVQNTPRWFNYSLRAKYFEGKKKYKDAIDDLTQALALTNNDNKWRIEHSMYTPSGTPGFIIWKSTDLLRRGNLYVLTGEYEKAIADFKLAKFINKNLEEDMDKTISEITQKIHKMKISKNQPK